MLKENRPSAHSHGRGAAAQAAPAAPAGQAGGAGQAVQEPGGDGEGEERAGRDATFQVDTPAEATGYTPLIAAIVAGRQRRVERLADRGRHAEQREAARRDPRRARARLERGELLAREAVLVRDDERADAAERQQQA